jgi:hypothetical protein
MVLTGRTCIAAWPTNVARHHIFTVTDGLFLPKGYRCTHSRKGERYPIGGGVSCKRSGGGGMVLASIGGRLCDNRVYAYTTAVGLASCPGHQCVLYAARTHTNLAGVCRKWRA